LDQLSRRISEVSVVGRADPIPTISAPLVSRIDPIASGPLLPKTTRRVEPSRTATLTRALGLKIRKVVVDAGHGGHDTGTVGPNGVQEKDVVLDIALRLGRLLEEQLGCQVVYTRTDDTFIPLRERTAIANREQADLFISIHGNSSGDPDARGVETYYLSLPRTAHELAVAHRENAVGDYSEHDLQSIVERIELSDKVQESRSLARTIQRSLSRVAGEDSRGIKTAPFVVLIGAQMPSVLAEVAFVSNEGEERLLDRPAYRQRLARGLYAGIAAYIRAVNGEQAPRLAQAREKLRSVSSGAER
jgi:N-acetylmuramoyl-L-alanine amidase